MTHKHDISSLDELLSTAGVSPGATVETRLMGTDPAMVEAIIAVIANGEKSATFSLPWVNEHEGRGAPQVGQLIAVMDTTGTARVLLRLTATEPLTFGTIGEAHVAREGKALRELGPWRDLHRAVWTGKLAPLGRAVSDDMPVCMEVFEVLAIA